MRLWKNYLIKSLSEVIGRLVDNLDDDPKAVANKLRIIANHIAFEVKDTV